MKLYFLAILLGETIMSVGPLPYDMPECERRLEHFQTEIDEGLRRCEMAINGLCVQPGQLVLACRESATRPAITELRP